MNRFIRHSSPHDSYDQVRFDDLQGASDATKLLELGHRDVRLLAIRAGMKPNELAGGVSDDQNIDGQHTLDLLLERKVPIGAILAGTEETAHGVRESIRRHRLEIPRDMSLIGFDDQYEEQRLLGITTVRIDSEEIEMSNIEISTLKEDARPTLFLTMCKARISFASKLPIWKECRCSCSITWRISGSAAAGQ